MQLRCLAAIACGLLLATPAIAGPDDDASFQITPYLWAAGFGGSIRPLPNSPVFDVSQSFGEILENLDAAFFVSALARKDRLVLVADVSHTSASRDGLVPTPVPGVPVIPAEGRLKQTSLTVLGGLRAIDQPGISIDLLAGLRANWLETTVAAPAIGIARSPEASFVDPLVAVRINGRLADGWSLLLYGDAGGFGAGSEFTSQLVGTVNARVARRIWLSAGYRFLSVDYRGDTTRADVELGGPLLGMTFTF